jgi:hypothetical protein
MMIGAPFGSLHGTPVHPPATPMKNGPPRETGLERFTKFTQRPNRAFAGLATAKLAVMIVSPSANLTTLLILIMPTPPSL